MTGENTSQETLQETSKEAFIEKAINEVEKRVEDSILFSKGVKLLHTNPRVFTIENFLNDEECEYIKSKASTSLRASVVSESKGGVVSSGRTSQTTWLSYVNDPMLNNISQKSADIFSKILPNVEWKNFEQLQVVKYEKGQEYRWHWDAYDFDTDRGKRCTAERGQRLYTVIFYLSDVEEGGETGFRDLKNVETNQKPLLVKPVKGSALVFQNTYENTKKRDPLSLHAGMPVESGEKWIANFWLREIPFDKPRTRYEPKTETPKTVQLSPEIPFYLPLMVSNSEHNDYHKDYKRLYRTLGYLMGEIRTSGALFNKDHLLQDYSSLKESDYAIVNNVYPEETAKIIRDYYVDMIKNKNFPLGDRQSNRYKARNEKISRIMNFDLASLISKIVGHPMKASYTYLSGYVNGSDLPLHVDRAECEFTCSFLIAKDDLQKSWPIYLEKITDRGCTGRCNYTVTDEECIALECEENGFMIFRGASKGGHAHMRKPYEGEYAYYLLLHYVRA